MGSMLRRAMIGLLAVCAAVWLGGAQAQTPQAADAAATPEPVRCKLGARVMQLSGLDARTNDFTADLWLWSLCPDDDGALGPLHNPEFPGALRVTLSPLESVLKDDIRYDYRRAQLVVQHDWKISQYPFDSHWLTINIETSDFAEEVMALTPDIDKSGIEVDATSDAWSVESFAIDSLRHTYGSNFGAFDASATYSRIDIAILIERKSWFSFFKLTTALYVSVVFALLALFYDNNNASHYTGRVGAAMAALFAVIISLRSVDAALGDTPELTSVAQLHLFGMAVILGVAIYTVWDRLRSERLGTPSRHPQTLVALVLASLFVASNIWVIGRAAEWF